MTGQETTTPTTLNVNDTTFIDEKEFYSLAITVSHENALTFDFNITDFEIF